MPKKIVFELLSLELDYQQALRKSLKADEEYQE